MAPASRTNPPNLSEGIPPPVTGPPVQMIAQNLNQQESESESEEESSEVVASPDQGRQLLHQQQMKQIQVI